MYFEFGQKCMKNIYFLEELMGKLVRLFFIFRKNEELIGMLGYGYCCQVISGFLEFVVDYNIQGLNFVCIVVVFGGIRVSVVLYLLWRIFFIIFVICILCWSYRRSLYFFLFVFKVFCEFYKCFNQKIIIFSSRRVFF